MTGAPAAPARAPVRAPASPFLVVSSNWKICVGPPNGRNGAVKDACAVNGFCRVTVGPEI